MDSMRGLSIHIAEKRFPAVGGAEDRLVLQDLELELPEGRFTCLIGPSGCGKTTLLNIIAGLDRDFRGAVGPSGTSGTGAPRIGYVFQTPRLLPWKTVEQNVDLVVPRDLRGSGLSRELLEAVGLWDSRRFYPARLSVGMQRRVALARAYAVRPELLLMDEPFVSLDEGTAERLRRLLLEIWRARRTTVLFVTHDLREAAMLGDRLVLLSPRPARVVELRSIDIPHKDRAEPGRLDRICADIRRRHPAIFEADSP